MNQLFPAIKDSETNSKFLTIAFLKHFLRYPPPEILDLEQKKRPSFASVLIILFPYLLIRETTSSN